jgi:outer membrane protein assembly factor BamB
VVLQAGKDEPVLRKYDVRKLTDRDALASDKTPEWTRSLDGAIRSYTRGQKLYHYASLLVAGDTVVVAGRLKGTAGGNDPAPTARQVAAGVLRTYDLRTGEPRQTLDLDAAPVVSGLAAAYGRVYVACEDGSLRCFD